MAAKAGVFDFIFKSGAKAAKEMSKGAGAAAKKAPSNVKVVPPKSSATSRGPIGRTKKYYEETGRPKVVNGRPIPSGVMASKPTIAKKKSAPMPKPAQSQGVAPAKKAVPVKKAVPGQISPSLAKKKTDALGGLKPREMGSSAKPAPKKVAPIKKTQPFVAKPSAPRFKEPGGRTTRPTMGLKKYPPTKNF